MIFKIPLYAKVLKIKFAMRLTPGEVSDYMNYGMKVILASDPTDSFQVIVEFIGSQIKIIYKLNGINLTKYDKFPYIVKSNIGKFDFMSMTYQWVHFQIVMKWKKFKNYTHSGTCEMELLF